METIIKTSNLRRKHTTFTRCRTLALVFAGIALLSLVSGLPPDICSTPECLQTALRILGKMNTEVNPCDNFYDYACGSFTNKTELINGKDYISSISELEDRIRQQLIAVLRKQRAKSDLKVFKLPYKLYKACNDTELIESLGLKPMRRIAIKLGGWPVLEPNWNNSWTWQSTVPKSRSFGFNHNYIVSLTIETHPNNTNTRIINLDQPFLGFSQSDLAQGFTSRVISIYFDFMVDIAVLFGAARETAERELRKALQFEMNLAKIYKPRITKTKSKDEYNLLSIKQMQQANPYMNWQEYINGILPDGIMVTEDTIINVSVLSFFEGLGKLLNETETRDIANYWMGRIHADSAEYLSKELRERKSQYKATLYQRLRQWSATEDCETLVLRRLPEPIDSLYVREFVKPRTKPDVLEIVNSILKVFGGMLNGTQWMDQETKQKAIQKLNLLNKFIGYSDQLLDDNKLKEYYKKLHIDPEKYFISILRMNVFDTDESLNQLKIPVNASNWKVYDRPAIVNAFYEKSKNLIKFTAGILQGDFFNSDSEKFRNFAGIGSVIGHEITHAFVGYGSQYDGHGNPGIWWQNYAQTAYREKERCLIDQYSVYTDEETGLNVNGENTAEENSCDHGGLKSSYLAYDQWLTQNGEEHRLPGLNLTSRQMYWLLKAQTECSKFSESYTTYRVLYNPHALPRFRILGPFRNMKEFARDFQCAAGTSMNPVNKCEVW